MPIIATDINFYGSATMPLDDTTTNIGGAIDTTRSIVFEDVTPSGNIQIVSTLGGDTTQTVTVTGRDAAGVLISETKTLNGQTPVAMTTNTTWERLLRAVKSASTGGVVAVEQVTAGHSGTAQAGGAQQITLAAGASATNNAYRGWIIRITAGTGAGQIRSITETDQAQAYNGATKIATVNRAWSVQPDNTSQYRISPGMLFDLTPHQIMEVRRPFYAAVADAPGGAARTFHEKIFVKNSHATLTLTAAQIIEQADPSAVISFAVESSLGGSDTNGAGNSRLVAPGGYTFDSAAKNVANSQNFTALGVQGVWLRLTLAAGAAPAKSSVTLRCAGNTT